MTDKIIRANMSLLALANHDIYHGKYSNYHMFFLVSPQEKEKTIGSCFFYTWAKDLRFWNISVIITLDNKCYLL